jgi:hypothetical protein
MTIETSTSSPTPGDNEALIAQIPPAMQKKLRRDARTKTRMFGVAAVLVGGQFTSGRMPVLLGEHSAAIFSVLGIVFALGGMALCIASFFRSDGMLWEEVHYRRQQGKWRWEH